MHSINFQALHRRAVGGLQMDPCAPTTGGVCGVEGGLRVCFAGLCNAAHQLRGRASLCVGACCVPSCAFGQRGSGPHPLRQTGTPVLRRLPASCADSVTPSAACRQRCVARTWRGGHGVRVYVNSGQEGKCVAATPTPPTHLQAAPDAKLSDLKTLLGRMLFSGLAVEKKVHAPPER